MKSFGTFLSGRGLIVIIQVLYLFCVFSICMAQATPQPLPDSFRIGFVNSPQVAGRPFTVSITAVYTNGMVVIGFNGTVSLSDTTGTIEPYEATLEAGKWSGPVTITKAETRIVISVQAENRNGTSNMFDVDPNVATQLHAELPTNTPLVGEPLDLTIIAKDEFNNTATTYRGTVLISSTASKYTAPASVAFTAVDKGFIILAKSVIFYSADPASVMIIISDSKDSSIAGRFMDIRIQHASPYRLMETLGVDQHGYVGKKLDERFEVTLLDQFGNPIADHVIEWKITLSPSGSRGQELVEARNVTDSSGKAQALLLLGNIPGTYLVEANSVSIPWLHASFRVTVTIMSGFEVFLGSTTGSVTRGSSRSLIVNIASFGGHDLPLGIQATGQPAGISIEFNPPSGVGNFTSKATITAGPLVSYGTYPINITVTAADGSWKIKTYTITVEGPPSDFVRDFLLLGIGFGIIVAVIIKYAQTAIQIVSAIFSLIPGLFAAVQASIGLFSYLDLLSWYTISFLGAFITMFALLPTKLRKDFGNLIKATIRVLRGLVHHRS